MLTGNKIKLKFLPPFGSFLAQFQVEIRENFLQTFDNFFQYFEIILKIEIIKIYLSLERHLIEIKKLYFIY